MKPNKNISEMKQEDYALCTCSRRAKYKSRATSANTEIIDGKKIY